MGFAWVRGLAHSNKSHLGPTQAKPLLPHLDTDPMKNGVDTIGLANLKTEWAPFRLAIWVVVREQLQYSEEI